VNTPLCGTRERGTIRRWRACATVWRSTCLIAICRSAMELVQAQLAERLPLLITGITGVAGYNALFYFRQRYPGRVIGMRPRQTWRFPGNDVIALDAEDRAGLRELFRAYRFRAVLNCTGNCALKSCECDPEMARQLNVASADALVEQTRAFGCRLVHLSTDL